MALGPLEATTLPAKDKGWFLFFAKLHAGNTCGE
jgi:hypothetical protein